MVVDELFVWGPYNEFFDMEQAGVTGRPYIVSILHGINYSLKFVLSNAQRPSKLGN